MLSVFRKQPSLSVSLLAAFVLFFCGRAVGQELGNVVGQIQFPGGALPDERIMITLETRGITITSVYADNEGRFGFYRLPGNVYYIVIQKDGFEPLRQSVLLNPVISRTVHMRVVLRPIGVSLKREPAQPASGGNPNLVSAENYEKEFPPAAVKEFRAGIAAEEKDKADRAIEHYEKALRLAPDFYPARNNLGAQYLRKGDFAAAEKQFADVIRLNPSDGQGYFNLANVLLLKKLYSDSLRSLENGLRRDPQSAFGHLLFGSVSIRVGDLAAAEEHLRRARELDPNMSKVRLELANLYLQTNRKNEAVQELKDFLRDYPKDAMAPRVKDLLKKLEVPPTGG